MARSDPLKLDPRLGGVWARDATDTETIGDVIAMPVHLPLAALSPGTVLDLGCHAGYTMVDMALRFPEARIVGYDVDFGNFLLAAKNVARFGERVTVVHTAIAPWDGTCSYYGTHSNAFKVFGGGDVPCSTLGKVIERWAPVAFMKLDIEGMERSAIAITGDWSRVAEVKVELHDGYGIDECRHDLEVAGFDTLVDPRHPACLAGFRRLGK